MAQRVQECNYRVIDVRLPQPGEFYLSGSACNPISGGGVILLCTKYVPASPRVIIKKITETETVSGSTSIVLNVGLNTDEAIAKLERLLEAARS